MKILVFLQNQWFDNPDKVRQIFERHPGRRSNLIKGYLFAGCLTGRRLREAWGDDLCNAIVWENASPQIGDKSSASFPADLEHMHRAIEEEKPQVVVSLGKTAEEALRKIVSQSWASPPNRPTYFYLYGPHPASRKPNVIQKLQEIAVLMKTRASHAEPVCHSQDDKALEEDPGAKGLCKHRRGVPGTQAARSVSRNPRR